MFSLVTTTILWVLILNDGKFDMRIATAAQAFSFVLECHYSTQAHILDFQMGMYDAVTILNSIFIMCSSH